MIIQTLLFICSTALLLSRTSKLGSDCSGGGRGEQSASTRPLPSVTQSHFAYTDRLYALSTGVESHVSKSDSRHSVPQQKQKNQSAASAATLTAAAELCGREPVVREAGQPTGPTTVCSPEPVARGVPRTLLEPLNAGCDSAPYFLTCTVLYCTVLYSTRTVRSTYSTVQTTGRWQNVENTK